MVEVFVPVSVSVPHPVRVSVNAPEMLPLIRSVAPSATCTVVSLASTMLLEIWWPVPDSTVMFAGLVIVSTPAPVFVILPVPIKVSAVWLRELPPKSSVAALESVPIKIGVVEPMKSSALNRSVPYLMLTVPPLVANKLLRLTVPRLPTLPIVYEYAGLPVPVMF